MESLKEQILKLKPDDYISFMQDVHRSYPLRSTELTNKIVNKWKNDDKKDVKSKGMPKVNQRANSSCSGLGSNPPSSQPQGHHVSDTSTQVPPGEVPKPGPSSCSGLISKSVSSQPKPWQISAWKTGVIFRGDKVPLGDKLFMDVEKITLKLQPGQKSHFQKAATIAVVNQDGKVVLWAFIKTPDASVCQYCYKMTHLTEKKLETGIDLETLHLLLKICLKGNQVIGAAIDNDFKSLQFPFAATWDLQNVYQDGSGQPFGLGHIARYLLNNRSGFQEGHHTAIDDARMTLRIYLNYLDSIKKGTFQRDLNRLSDTRQEYKKSCPKFFAEKCRCKN